MKKITCISFHGSGSGAVDDYLREFNNIAFAPSEIECRFLQDPNGISDLEYNLVENPHRLNSSHAIKMYYKYATEMSGVLSKTYLRIFGDDWMKYTDEYVESLISNKYKGYWHGDVMMFCNAHKLLFSVRRTVNKLLPCRYRKPIYYNYYPNIDFYHSYLSEEEFLLKTKMYVEKLCESINTSNKEYVLLDQFVATSNIKRYMRYADDLKAIIVDRDPRDLFIAQTLLKDHVLPKDPHVFASVYRDQRKMVGKLPEDASVMYLRFEDLIYNYDTTIQKINDFLGLKECNHIASKQHFNPAISQKNTRLWISHPEFDKEAKIIEGLLPEYLYDYEDLSRGVER